MQLIHIFSNYVNNAPELQTLWSRAKVIRESGVLLGMSLVVSQAAIKVCVPMSRVIQRLTQNRLLDTTWIDIKKKFGTDPKFI